MPRPHTESAPVEDPPTRRMRTGPVALGVVAIIASVLWTLLWGALALAASAFGGDTSGWVIVSAALAFGVLVFVLGVSLVRGRPPSGWGWLAVAGTVLALFALPLSSWSDDRSTQRFNRPAERAYAEHSGQTDVKADCDLLWTNPDGSERVECIFESSAVYDICDVSVTTERGVVTADIGDCLNARR